MCVLQHLTRAEPIWMNATAHRVYFCNLKNEPNITWENKNNNSLLTKCFKLTSNQGLTAQICSHLNNEFMKRWIHEKGKKKLFLWDSNQWFSNGWRNIKLLTHTRTIFLHSSSSSSSSILSLLSLPFFYIQFMFISICDDFIEYIKDNKTYFNKMPLLIASLQNKMINFNWNKTHNTHITSHTCIVFENGANNFRTRNSMNSFTHRNSIWEK